MTNAVCVGQSVGMSKSECKRPVSPPAGPAPTPTTPDAKASGGVPEQLPSRRVSQCVAGCESVCSSPVSPAVCLMGPALRPESSVLCALLHSHIITAGPVYSRVTSKGPWGWLAGLPCSSAYTRQDQPCYTLGEYSAAIACLLLWNHLVKPLGLAGRIALPLWNLHIQMQDLPC